MTCTVILLSYPAGIRDVQIPPKGSSRDVGLRLAQHIELAGVLHVVQLVPDPVLPQPLRAQLELGRGPPAGVRFVELVDVHRRHTIADQDHCSCPGGARLTGAGWEGSGEVGGRRSRAITTATSTSKPRVALIDQMAAEWQSIGRSRSRRPVAPRSRRPRSGPVPPGPRRLPAGVGPPPCPTPCDLVDHMRRASGRAQREEAARLVRVLLREADADPFICRMLVQALLPGLVTVAGKLRWGRGGEWQDGEEFFGELLSTTWLVLQEWSGQDRPYAVLDLLSAIRCRLRRQLFRSKELDGPIRPARPRPGRSGVRLVPTGDRPRGAGPHPDRPAPRGDAARRGPGPLRPSTSSATPWPSCPP